MGSSKFKKRFFVLDKERLYYYKSEKQKDKDINFISLINAQLYFPRNDKQKLCFEINTPTRNCTLKARSQIDFDGWVNAIVKQSMLATEKELLNFYEKKTKEFEKNTAKVDYHLIQQLREPNKLFKIPYTKAVTEKYLKEPELIDVLNRILTYDEDAKEMTNDEKCLTVEEILQILDDLYKKAAIAGKRNLSAVPMHMQLKKQASEESSRKRLMFRGRNYTNKFSNSFVEETNEPDGILKMNQSFTDKPQQFQSFTDKPQHFDSFTSNGIAFNHSLTDELQKQQSFFSSGNDKLNDSLNVVIGPGNNEEEKYSLVVDGGIDRHKKHRSLITEKNRGRQKAIYLMQLEKKMLGIVSQKLLNALHEKLNKAKEKGSGIDDNFFDKIKENYQEYLMSTKNYKKEILLTPVHNMKERIAWRSEKILEFKHKRKDLQVSAKKLSNQLKFDSDLMMTSPLTARNNEQKKKSYFPFYEF